MTGGPSCFRQEEPSFLDFRRGDDAAVADAEGVLLGRELCGGGDPALTGKHGGGRLRVDVLTEGVHSGDASGIVPSSFRILRQLLDRVDDVATGRVRVEGLHVQIPPARLEQAKAMAQVLGQEVYSRFPWVPGAQPVWWTFPPSPKLLSGWPSSSCSR